MDGYLQSLETTWRHAFKQKIRPGGKVPLDDLYKQYGQKHGIKAKEFIEWLKQVKLANSINTWMIVEMDDEAPVDLSTTVEEKEEKAKEPVISELTVEDIVQLAVRKARDIIPVITDIRLLKYARQEAGPRANKESLCRILDKRIQEVELLRSS